jgi:hypothetical protein
LMVQPTICSEVASLQSLCAWLWFLLEISNWSHIEF